jgi:hypothetical protein
MSSKRRGAKEAEALSLNTECRIDFQNGVLYCTDIEGEATTKRIVLYKSAKKKGEINIYDALKLAGMDNAVVKPATLAFTPHRDPESKELRIYVPAVLPNKRLGFLYDDGGRFGFTTYVPWGYSTVYVPDINCNVVINDIIGQEIPPKEEFEKALNKLAHEFDFLGKYREIVLFLLLYPYVYVYFLRRPIPTITGPFRAGKTTVLELVESIIGRSNILRGHYSLAGARGLLAYYHVILDDFGEHTVMEDPNLGMLLEYHDRGVVAKVDDRLQTKVFPMRGVLYLSGGYAINLLRLSSYTERLWLVKIALTRNMISTMNVVFNSIIKDAEYYRWALSRLYLYFHEYYLSLNTSDITLPHRRDPLLTPHVINALLLQKLDDSKMPTLTVENMAENAKKHAADVHMAIVAQILRYLLKRRARGFDRAKNKVFKFKGQDVEFYHVQYVYMLDMPLPVWHGTVSQTVTVSIGATKTVSKSATFSRPRIHVTPSMLQAIIDMYDYLNEYFIVAAPDGKSYSVWVRADAVDEAIRWLIFTIQEHAPHYLDNFPTLVDEETRKAYEEVMKRLEGEKPKNGAENNKNK